MSKFLKQKVKEESFIPFVFPDRKTRLWDSLAFAYTKVGAAPHPGRTNFPK